MEMLKRYLEGGRKGLGESSRGNEYQKEIDDLKRLVGDQALVSSNLYIFSLISVQIIKGAHHPLL